jgi:multicomponent Na+:H+ antiporter subunit B
MLATAIGLVRLRNLFAVAMLSGIFTLTAAGLYVVLDAVDVAFTEAAVGAGVSTILMLATLALTGREEKATRSWNPLALTICLITGAILIYGTLDMPLFGDPTAPAALHVAPRYLDEALAATGVPNVVTAVLASYRGYDTLGETVVIFSAAIGVYALLAGRRRYAEPEVTSPILRAAARLLVAPILIYALYVQFHGDFGPGGGFQAGVILGAAFVLYALAEGLEKTRRILPNWLCRALLSLGVLIYAGTGALGLVLADGFLDYDFVGQHLGIFVVEFGVCLTVFAAMAGILLTYAERRMEDV